MNYLDILRRIARALESIDASMKEAVELLRIIKTNTDKLNYYEDE